MPLRIASTIEQLSEAGRRLFAHHEGTAVDASSYAPPGGGEQPADGGPVRLAASLEELAAQRREAGDAAAAEALLRSALVLRDGAGAEASGTAAVHTLDALAALCTARGADDEAVALLERALRAANGAGADQRELAGRLRALAEAHARHGNPTAAEPLLERALALARQSAVAGHELAAILTSLAGAHSALGRHGEAERRLREALVVAGVDPLLRQLAGELAAQGRAAEAAAIAGRPDDAGRPIDQRPRDDPPRLLGPGSGGPSPGGSTLTPRPALAAASATDEPSPVAPSSDGIKLFAAAAALTIVRSSPPPETGVTWLGNDGPPAPRDQLVLAERSGSATLDRAPAAVKSHRRYRTHIAVAAVVVFALVAGRMVVSSRGVTDEERAAGAGRSVGGDVEVEDSAPVTSGRPDGAQVDPTDRRATGAPERAFPDRAFVVVMPSSTEKASATTRGDSVRRRPRSPSTPPAGIAIDTRVVDESLRGRAEFPVVTVPAIARPEGPLPPVDGRALGGRPPR
jgi:tetratricopeptide (TPR) repeat protein